MCTGEGWNCIMGDASLEEYPCSKERGDCGNKYFAWVYFYSFTIVGHFILLNLFLAVVLENFGKDEGSTETTITDQDFATFFSLWHKYDRDGEGFINFSDLNRFLQELPPPLGMGQKASRIRLLQLHRKYKTLLRREGLDDAQEAREGFDEAPKKKRVRLLMTSRCQCSFSRS